MSEHLVARWRRIQRAPLVVWDVLLAATGIVVSVAAVAIAGQLESHQAIVALAVVASVCSCSAFARRLPLTAALTACLFMLPGVLLRDWPAFQIALDGLIIPVFLFAYRLGTRTPTVRSLAGIVLLGACWQAASDDVNPFILIDTVGPWVLGLITRSRAGARDELEIQGLELARAQARYDTESVRYERTRIARELHDIVAHCVTVMVVQAGAAQYLTDRDTQGALDALDTISESARQAETEIARLVTVLGEPPEQPYMTIDELIRRTRATGLAISYELVGDADRLSAQTLDTAYRIVREAVTNALKHAPGAQVDIALRCAESAVQLQITNAAPRAAGLDLESTGGGHGLDGMRERVAGCGGELRVGPTTEGGWRVIAHLPSGVRASI